MKKTVILMVVFSFIMVGTLTYIGIRYEESVKEYNALESDIEEGAQIYLELNEIELSVGENYKIKAETLLNENYIETMSIDDEECIGYANIKRNLTDYEYQAYIKCEDYTTVDYQE